MTEKVGIAAAVRSPSQCSDTWPMATWSLNSLDIKKMALYDMP